MLNFLSNLCSAGASTSEADQNVWSLELARHFCGDFSLSVGKAHTTIEDHSLVETGRNALFAGVYDGHGGYAASRYVRDNLFPNLIRIIKENGSISEDVIRAAFAATEDDFLALVRRSFSRVTPSIAHAGSCCIVAIIWNGTLHVANLGDSRAVLGSINRLGNIFAEQLTDDHNVKRKVVRRELRALHPDDPDIVVQKRGVWRVRGHLTVSRAIGDAYLKKPEYKFDEYVVPRLHLLKPIIRPVLSAVPTVLTRNIARNSRFLILASDGLWDQLTNQEAVQIVHSNPRPGIAKMLVERAISVAILRYKKRRRPRCPREVHDDMTVIVIYIDNERRSEGAEVTVQQISVKGCIGISKNSLFATLEERAQSDQ